MNRKEMTAQQLVQYYLNKQKTFRIIQWVVVAIYLLAVIRLWGQIDFLNLMVFALVLISILSSLRKMGAKYFSPLQQVLTEDCDPAKYVEIMNTLAETPKQDLYTARLCQAKGLYYDGNAEEALVILNQFNLQKPSAALAVLLQSTFFYCYIQQEDLDAARQARESAGLLLRSMRGKQYTALEEQLQAMDAVLALQEDRYEEFFTLQQQVLEEATTPLLKVTALYYLAQGELIQHKDEEARLHLEQIIQEGGSIFMVEEARSMLKEYLD